MAEKTMPDQILKHKFDDHIIRSYFIFNKNARMCGRPYVFSASKIISANENLQQIFLDYMLNVITFAFTKIAKPEYEISDKDNKETKDLQRMALLGRRYTADLWLQEITKCTEILDKSKYPKKILIDNFLSLYVPEYKEVLLSTVSQLISNQEFDKEIYEGLAYLDPLIMNNIKARAKGKPYCHSLVYEVSRNK